MLVERTPIGTGVPFVLSEVKEYTRIDYDDQDLTLERMALAAVAEVEHFAQVALLPQTIRVTILDVVLGTGLALPIGPVPGDATMTVTIDGQAVTDFTFETGMRGYLNWPSSIQGTAAARVVIEYPAGFGDAAGDVPNDLSIAVLDQVALMFDARAPSEAKTLARSSHLARIGARYRGVSM